MMDFYKLREARITRNLARRRTPAFTEAGAALTEARAQEAREAQEKEEAAKARERAARRATAIDADPQRVEREARKLLRQVELGVLDARRDHPDLGDDDLHHAIWQGARLAAPTKLVRREAARMLGFDE